MHSQLFGEWLQASVYNYVLSHQLCIDTNQAAYMLHRGISCLVMGHFAIVLVVTTYNT